MLNLSKYQNLGNNLFLCFDDSVVRKTARSLNVEEELMASVKSNTDFVTAMLNINKGTNCDLVIFMYAGALKDSGFLCFILTNFIQEQLNINGLLSRLKEVSPMLQIAEFKNHITELVYEHFKQNPEIRINHFMDDNNLIFSLIQ